MSSIGFGRTVVANRIIENLDFPDEAAIDAHLARQHALFVAVKTQELEALLAGLPARKYNPARLCSAEDVRAIYRLLLHRDPNSQAVIDTHVQATPVVSLVRGILQSEERAGILRRLNNP